MVKAIIGVLLIVIVIEIIILIIKAILILVDNKCIYTLLLIAVAIFLTVGF